VIIAVNTAKESFAPTLAWVIFRVSIARVYVVLMFVRAITVDDIVQKMHVPHIVWVKNVVNSA